MSTPMRILVWADAEQESLVRDVMAAGEFELLGVGSDSSAAAAALSAALGAERLGDLRQALRQPDADVFWIASPLTLDIDTLRVIAKVKRRVVTASPQPALARDDAEVSTGRLLVCPAPLMRQSAAFRAVLDSLPEAGRVEAVNICFRSRPAESSLFARLFDAMDVIELLCGEPDVIDACLTGPTGAVPESTASLAGHITANLRFSDNRSASLFVSDRGGRWFRGATVMTEQGSFRITDSEHSWMLRAGGEPDTTHVPLREHELPSLIAQSTQRWGEGRDASDPPMVIDRLLAMCEAARLSCRTGEGEAPHTMLRMLRRP